MQEAIFVDNLSGEVRSFVISKHYMRAFGEDFTVVCKLQLGAVDRSSYRTDYLDVVHRAVDGDDGR